MKDFRYIMTGTLDHPGDLPPKGEFWCKRREKWYVLSVEFSRSKLGRLLLVYSQNMSPSSSPISSGRAHYSSSYRMPEVPGIFHKQEIKE